MKPSSSTQRRASSDRALDVVRRDHARAEHAVGGDVAEVLQPVVVGPGDGGGELGLEAVGADLLDESRPRTNRPRDGKSTARSRPSASMASICDCGVPARAPRTRRRRCRAPPASRSCGPRRASGATVPMRSITWFLTRTRMSRGISDRPTRRGVRVRRVDVALPEVGRLHHVQVAVADDVVAKAHAVYLTLVPASSALTGYAFAATGLSAGPAPRARHREDRMASASSGWATSAGTSRPTSWPTATTSSCTTSTRARGRRSTGATPRRVGRRRRRRERGHGAVAADARRSSRQVAAEWATTARAGLDPRRPVHEQPRRRARARRRASPASGHHLVEAPLTGGAIGAEKRMLVVHGRRRRRRRRRACDRCSSRSAARTFHLGPARARQHHEAGQQPASPSPPPG